MKPKMILKIASAPVAAFLASLDLSRKKNVVAITAVILLLFSLNQVCLAQSYGAVTGTNLDQYVINNDKSNNWGMLRLQTSTDRGWTLVSGGSQFSSNFLGGVLGFYFDNSGNFGTNGAQLMTLSSVGDLWIPGSFSAYNIKASNYLFVTSPYASWDHLGFTHDGSVANILAGGADAGIAFKVSNNNSLDFPNQPYSEVMRILPSGNVGIGTTIPTHKLDVVGDINLTSQNLALTPPNSVSTGGGLITLANGGVSANGYVAAPSLFANSSLKVGNLITNTSITGTSLSTGSITTTGNITSSGTISAAGITVPSFTTAGAITAASLTAAGSGSIIGLQNGASWDHLYMQHDGATAFINAGGADNGLAIKVGSGGSGGYGGQTYTEAMRVLANGNIGIGKSSPSQKLDVAGNINSSGSITAATLNIGSTSITANGTFIANTIWTGVITANGLSLPSSGSFITTQGALTSGSVSTGTLTSTSLSTGNITSTGTITANSLTVPSLTTTGALSGSSITTAGALTSGSVSTGNITSTGAITANTLNITSGFTLPGITNANGNIGIGTTNPSQKLDVAGNINSTGNVNSIGFYVKNNVGVNGVGWDIKGGTSLINSANQNALLFNYDNNGSEQTVMLVNGDNGNVGIGTTTPDKGRLHVKGSMHVENSSGDQVFHVSAGQQLVFVGADAYTQYVATQNNTSSQIQTDDYTLWVSKGIVSEDFAIADVSEWDDYVFNEDYHLPTLKDVSTFIQKNKHLPNVPSATTVKNGYTLHAMNRNFLKTIEELTLYAIDQDKKVDELKLQAIAQDKKIENLQQQLDLLRTLAEEVASLKKRIGEK